MKLSSWWASLIFALSGLALGLIVSLVSILSRDAPLVGAPVEEAPCYDKWIRVSASSAGACPSTRHTLTILADDEYAPLIVCRCKPVDATASPVERTDSGI